MPKHQFTWSIDGEIWIDAPTADDARIEFDNMTDADLSAYGERTRHSGPETQEEMDAAAQRRRERLAAAMKILEDREPEPSHG